MASLLVASLPGGEVTINQIKLPYHTIPYHFFFTPLGLIRKFSATPGWRSFDLLENAQQCRPFSRKLTLTAFPQR